MRMLLLMSVLYFMIREKQGLSLSEDVQILRGPESTESTNRPPAASAISAETAEISTLGACMIKEQVPSAFFVASITKL